MTLRRTLAWSLAALLAVAGPIVAGIALRPEVRARPIVFVHGMGASAAQMGVPGGHFEGLLSRLARRFPRPDVCSPAAQAERPWSGSPCVFRYVEDRAEAAERGAARQGANDSQSGVEENARKLAREVAETVRRAGGDPVVLVGYSMGGAIIRAYLALHRTAAERLVAGVVLLDPVTAGSWGFLLDIRRFPDDPLTSVLTEVVARGAALVVEVDLDRPAYRDLQPGSDLLQRVASRTLPRRPDYVTFWGDLRVEVGLPGPGTLDVPVGDLLLLPGDPDPSTLPALGGQRFAPTPGAVEVAHRQTIPLGGAEVAALTGDCLALGDDRRCADSVRAHFPAPGAHWRLPFTLDEVEVEASVLGGGGSLEDAMIAAVARSA